MDQIHYLHYLLAIDAALKPPYHQTTLGPTSFMIDAAVSHYHVISKLDGVGVGLVYQTEDTRLHRFIALNDSSLGTSKCLTAILDEDRTK
ncbi:MAG TPA: hypothetical protein VF783_04275 [Terriglobales bacterium]